MIIILKFVDEESCKYMKCHVCTLHCIVLLKLPLQHKAGVNGEPEGVHEVLQVHCGPTNATTATVHVL